MLILEPGLMGSMEDDHLLAALDAQPIILKSPVEAQLAWRLEGALDRLAEVSDLVELSEEFEFSGADLRPICECHPAPFAEIAKMLALLNDAEIMDADELSALIARSK